jgi:hypothetical protein
MKPDYRGKGLDVGGIIDIESTPLFHIFGQIPTRAVKDVFHRFIFWLDRNNPQIELRGNNDKYRDGQSHYKVKISELHAP